MTSTGTHRIRVAHPGGKGTADGTRRPGAWRGADAPDPGARCGSGRIRGVQGCDGYCAEHFGASQIDVTAHVSRNAGSLAAVAYAHYIQNIDTGKTTQLLVDNNTWYVFDDNHVINSGWPYFNSEFTWSGIDQFVPHGRCRVYTKYAWYSGYWVFSDWTPASVYANYAYGYGMLPYCKL